MVHLCAVRRKTHHLLAEGPGGPLGLARRTARARPRAGQPAHRQAAAAHVLGVLWASASRGATVKELRAAIGLTRERLEAAYAYLLAYPLLGLTVLPRATTSSW